MDYFSNSIALHMYVVQSNPYHVCFNSSTPLTFSNVVLYRLAGYCTECFWKLFVYFSWWLMSIYNGILTRVLLSHRQPRTGYAFFIGISCYFMVERIEQGMFYLALSLSFVNMICIGKNNRHEYIYLINKCIEIRSIVCTWCP